MGLIRGRGWSGGSAGTRRGCERGLERRARVEILTVVGLVAGRHPVHAEVTGPHCGLADLVPGVELGSGLLGRHRSRLGWGRRVQAQALMTLKLFLGFSRTPRNCLTFRTILNTPAPSIQKRTWPTPSPDCGSSAGSSVRHASSRTPTSGTKGCKSPSILAGAMPGPRERIREEELLAASCAHTGCIPASLGSVGAEMATGVSHTGGVGALVPWMSGLKLKSEAEPG